MPASADSQYPLFQVGTGKFVVLSICSFGIYDIYWTYEQWKRIAEGSGAAVSPFWRTFFGLIFNFALFERILDMATEDGVGVAWRPSVLATLCIILTLAIRLPGSWSLVGFAAFVAYLPVQITAEQVNDLCAASVTEPRNDRYGLGGIATVVIGGLLLVLVVLASFLSK